MPIETVEPYIHFPYDQSTIGLIPLPFTFFPIPLDFGKFEPILLLSAFVGKTSALFFYWIHIAPYSLNTQQI